MSKQPNLGLDMTQLRSLWCNVLTLSVAFVALAGVTEANAQDELELSASLEGNYSTGVSITGGTWEVSDPDAGISMVFAATGMADVNQFEFFLTFEPLSAFNIEIARFRGFVAEELGGVEIQSVPAEVEDDGRLHFAGGVLGDVINGDSELGTLLLTTSSTFDPNEPARILVDFFSIGPSNDERDEYDAETLNMGVIVAAATAVESVTWGSMKEHPQQ